MPCSPFLPMMIAVPVSWHIGRILPEAILAFLSRSRATNRSLSDASGSSRIFLIVQDVVFVTSVTCRKSLSRSVPKSPPGRFLESRDQKLYSFNIIGCYKTIFCSVVNEWDHREIIFIAHSIT